MPENQEVLIETQRIGHILRVTAHDVGTGTEIVFQAPANASRVALEKLAINKLRYVMSRGKA